MTKGAYRLEMDMSAATAAIGLKVGSGAVARTSNLVEITDASTDITGAALALANPASGGKALSVTSGRSIFAGRVEFGKTADLASATTITLAGTGNLIHLTGTTTIDYITPTNIQAGTMIVLYGTSDSITLTHKKGVPDSTHAELYLAAAGNVTLGANDAIILVYDGTEFRQVAPVLVG